MTIDYGDYPYGYETIVAFFYILNGNGFLIGMVHSIITLLLFLTIWFLGIRYTSIPHSVMFFLSGLLLASGFLPIESNLWWSIKYSIYTIGKNDLLLGTLILVFLLFSPISPSKNKRECSIPGMAVSSMLALSVKPNAVYTLIPIWVYTLILYLRDNANLNSGQKVLTIIKTILVIAPGCLWLIRNLIALNGRAFNNNGDLFSLSIINNLTNPKFINFIPAHFKAILIALFMSFLMYFILKKFSITIPLTFLILFLAFILTPASAFANISQERTEIAWRFAISLLIFTFLFLLILFENVIIKIINMMTKNKVIYTILAASCILFSILLLNDNKWVFLLNAKNTIVLKDQFREPIGVNGYHSAYEYVQKNIHKSIIWVDNGLPFYLYDDGMTNSVTRSVPADYYVVFQTDWLSVGKREYPENVLSDEFNSSWMLLYEDSEGRVYQRKN